mgnify:CR=1 FL=1
MGIRRRRWTGLSGEKKKNSENKEDRREEAEKIEERKECYDVKGNVEDMIER